MKPTRNKYVAAICGALGKGDTASAVETLVQPYRQAGGTLRSVALGLGAAEIIEEALPVDGAVVVDGGHRLTIRINSAHSPQRRRFTLAHEIGHLILSEFLGGKAPCHKDSQLEDACDAVAAELLMPVGEVVPLVRNQGAPSPERLKVIADYFGVSLPAAARRVHDDLMLWKHSIGLWEFKNDEGPGGFPGGVPSDMPPDEKWFVGRLWKTKRPPFAAFHWALASSSPVRTRESIIEDSECRPFLLEVLHLGHNRLLGTVGDNVDHDSQPGATDNIHAGFLREAKAELTCATKRYHSDGLLCASLESCVRGFKCGYLYILGAWLGVDADPSLSVDGLDKFVSKLDLLHPRLCSPLSALKEWSAMVHFGQSSTVAVEEALVNLEYLLEIIDECEQEGRSLSQRDCGPVRQVISESI